MSLVDCHECGKPVSTSASSCPNCGAPLQKVEQIKEDDPKSYMVWWLLIATIVIAVVVSILNPSPTTSEPEIDVVGFGKDCMRSEGLDPNDGSHVLSHSEVIAVGECLDKKLGR